MLYIVKFFLCSFVFPFFHICQYIIVIVSTCRFCDLVFQGPLSVQEDWIKHLQRHIMNTSVPHTGAGMVEVTSFPKDSSSNTVPQAQSSVMQTSSWAQEHTHTHTNCPWNIICVYIVWLFGLNFILPSVRTSGFNLNEDPFLSQTAF